MVHTRATPLAVSPVPLRRMSAMRPVRFTARGRRHARKLCLNDRDVYMYYYSSRDGVVMQHLCNRHTTLTFADAAAMPEFVYAS